MCLAFYLSILIASGSTGSALAAESRMASCDAAYDAASAAINRLLPTNADSRYGAALVMFG
jgi:hypothetical protein